MARAMVLSCAYFALFLVITIDSAQAFGVNWGTQMAQNLDPGVVIQILQDNKINKVKLFDSDHWTVKHFAGSGIQVMLGIPNNQLARYGDFDKAKDWVKENVSKHLHDGGVDIRYIAVGNEPFLKSYNGSNMKTTFPALENIQKAINEAGHGDKIKVTIPQNADVYESNNAPSDGNFRKDIRDLMVKIVHFLNDHNSPFLVNIYPFLSLYQNPDFPVDFAFFDGGGKSVHDNNINYNNVFDANLDTLVWSLKKSGVPKLKIVVGEIGWPTDGSKNANIKNARKFYDGLFKKLASNKGTPMYPGFIEVYLFSLTDENQKSIAPGDFERHWGVFRYDGQPKFPMDFSGKGNDVMPVGAKNVQYLPHQWCVLDSEVKETGAIPGNVQYACAYGDCTSLVPGGSCSKLDNLKRVSYAFNNYFQINNQDVESCDFQGLAKIVNENLSTSECLFPIAIQSAGARLYMATGLKILVSLFTIFTLLTS